MPLFNKLQAYLHEAHQWFLQTPDRSLEQAYKAALMIKTIEDEHFGGEKISTAGMHYSDSVMSYFMADLNKYLKTTKLRISEFKASRFVAIGSEQSLLTDGVIENPTSSKALEVRKKPLVIIDKLKFVDEVIDKYKPNNRLNLSSSLLAVSQSNSGKVDDLTQHDSILYQSASAIEKPVVEPDKISGKTVASPKSILQIFEQLQQYLDPKAEERVIHKFRDRQKNRLVSTKFLFILIIVPILTQQVTKTVLVGPVVDNFINHHKPEIFLNIDSEEEAFRELKKFENRLKFKSLTSQAPALSQQDMEKQLKHKASEIGEEYRRQSANDIKNVFADTIGLIAFCLILLTSKPEIQVIKNVINETAYHLSDSVKSFIIILSTDIFVGFHSPHGWEVILSGLTRHLGLQENRSFIFLFIATFPVFLDTIFKYWIFRYLSRMSPSAAATYRNMND